MENEWLISMNPLLILEFILKNKGAYASTISKRVECTYSHVVRILQRCHAAGLVKFTKRGRVKFVELTPVGLEIANKMEGLLRLIRTLDKSAE